MSPNTGKFKPAGTFNPRGDNKQQTQFNHQTIITNNTLCKKAGLPVKGNKFAGQPL